MRRFTFEQIGVGVCWLLAVGCSNTDGTSSDGDAGAGSASTESASSSSDSADGDTLGGGGSGGGSSSDEGSSVTTDDEPGEGGAGGNGEGGSQTSTSGGSGGSDVSDSGGSGGDSSAQGGVPSDTDTLGNAGTGGTGMVPDAGAGGSGGSAGSGGTGGVGGAGGSAGSGGAGGSGEIVCVIDEDCDDNDACTLDTCLDGTCSGTSLSPDDGDACTADACDPASGLSHVTIDPDDGDSCTVDTCDPVTGVSNTAQVGSDDGDACTIDLCDPESGVSHVAVNVDDDDPCTVDACDPVTGVSHAAIDVDDEDACTFDSCGPVVGVIHAPVSVDDQNVCTIDSCDSETGIARAQVDPDDDDACTVDSCDPVTGVANVPVVINDGNACTVDSCDPVTGVAHAPVTPTSDSNACTADTCNPVNGATIHTPIDLDDDDGCTTDSCDPITGVEHEFCASGVCDASEVCIDQTLIISEFRVRGPNGANDEFIEIYNISGADITVTSDADGSTGFGIAASDGVVRATIPNGTVIPAFGHYLAVNSVAYLLSSYPAGNGFSSATGDATYTTDIPDNAGIALFTTNIPANFSLATRLDAVGSTSEANTLYKEGTGYPALTPFSIDYSFYRRYPGTGVSPVAVALACLTGMGTGSRPVDTDANASDFLFVDTNGTSAGAGQRLGAPGPENLSSPLQGVAAVPSLTEMIRIDTSVGTGAVPNFVRDLTSAPATNSTLGTLDIRRRYTNETGANITRLRFRIIDVTTFPAPSGVADLRPLDSSDIVVSTGAGNVTVRGTTLETPPAQLNGSGFNGSLSANSVTIGTPLANGASIDVRFLMGVQQAGDFHFFIAVEALPAEPGYAWGVIGDTTDGIGTDCAP